MNKKITYILTVILSVVFIMMANKMVTKDSAFNKIDNDLDVVKAKITKVISESEGDYGFSETETVYETRIEFEAKLLNTEDKGKTIKAYQSINTLMAIQPENIQEGDKVLLGINQDLSSEIKWVFLEFVRSDEIIGLGILFMVALLIFGGIKGVNTIISLGFTCLSIFMVFIPSILAGKNIYLWSIITCVFIIIMTLLIVNGADKKSLAAGIGCFGGIFVSGALTLIMDKMIKLTGMVDDDSMYLQMLNPDNPIDLRAIVFASILIGAIGAIMDVSMSISSSLMEVYEKSSKSSVKELFKSGMNIGKDIMGTMANTLILAYIGSSLSVTLLLISYNYSFIELLNREMIVIEVLQSLVGSFGILLTIPLTSAVCAYLYTKNN